MRKLAAQRHWQNSQQIGDVNAAFAFTNRPEPGGWVSAPTCDLLRRSLVAQEIAEEREDAQPACGTVVLTINPDPELPHRWAVIRARIIPQLDEEP